MIYDTNGDQRRKSQRSDRLVHLVGNTIQRSETSSRSIGWRRRLWLGVALVAACTVCGIGVVRSGNAKTSEEKSITYKEAGDLTRQLRSLTQSDLIEFQDGRIWYVRSVRGDNIEVVGWIGDNTKLEFIPSFVLSDDRFRIIHKSDSDWASTRDKYLIQ